ncbi:MAG: hydroxymethylglutaryl-CoA reductase, degradative [Anaerolineales bacterium]|nr:hydroxymethylglutaryl-CoA reductase, degradative [Anaerolineales bacterium]MBX3037492.1 hydroxymethylglutaryl-CoA reductase, degradative [Anaerolineales bacterium]
MTTSRISGFYNLNLDERRAKIAESSSLLDLSMLDSALTTGLSLENALHMVENVIGLYALPLGIGLNFQINGRDVLVPMVIEEPSVVAGASFMAKLARAGGGFIAESTEPLMIGQLQVLDIDNLYEAKEKVLANKNDLIKYIDAFPSSIKKLGGGARDIEVKIIEDSPIGKFLVVHLIYDVRDAMGANAINTACEQLAPRVEALTGGKVHLKILSNLTDRRVTKSKCLIPAKELAFTAQSGSETREFTGEEVRDGIIAAYAFAAVDPYRATTHNKGIMNGVDAVVIATGNDWRAIEAGAHAYAARSGKYTSLSTWSKDDEGNLVGALEMPMAVGIVGGATKVHPAAQMAIQLMEVKSANELAEIIVSVGLAQNMAALRALATEGIQRGHMSLHARQIAISAGASGDLIEKVASQMVLEKNIRLERANELVKKLESGE